MNYQIRRTAAIDSCTKALRGIITRGDHIGAGLSIDIYIGQRGDKDPDVTVELCHDTEALLLLVIDALAKSRAEQVILAKSAIRDLQAFLDEQSTEA